MTWMTQPTRRADALLGLGVFIVAIMVSLVFWALIPGAYQENQSSDYTAFYEPVARNIVAGQGVTLDGEIATRYPPGFPIMIAGAFRLGGALGLSDATALLWFRLLCAGLSAVLLFAIARLVWLPVPALFVGLAWATYPFGLWLTKQPNSEVAFIPILFGAVYMLWRALLFAPRAWLLYLGAGGLAGAAMLVRPAAIGLGLVFAVLVLLFGGNGRRWLSRVVMATLILAGNLFVVLPWQGAVYAQSGEGIPLSSGGPISIQDGLTFLLDLKEYRRSVDVPADVELLMESFHIRRQEMDTTAALVAVVADEAQRQPVTFAKFMAIKATRSWYGTDSREFETIALMLQIIYLGLAVWGTVYAFRRGGDLRRMIAGNWLIAGYFWAMTIIVVPLLRYTLPVMGLLMIPLPGVYYAIAEWRRGNAGTPSPVLESDT